MLPEWYPPTGPEIADLVTTATIALDANVLLDLYRVSADQRKQILGLLGTDGVRPRVWMPYQAAHEYQQNRLKVAYDHKNHYETVRKAIDELPHELTKAINDLRDQSVREQLLTVVATSISEAQSTLNEAVEELQRTNVIAAEGIHSDDPIRDRIDEILADSTQVGPRPPDSVVADRKKVADGRYAAKRPPGYADHKKADPSGDLLMWLEILDRAEQFPDQPIILITGDVKEDWYQRSHGKTIGPRPELVAEFKSTANTRSYHQMTLKSFLHYANEHLGAGVGADTIASVEALTEARNKAERDRFVAAYPTAESCLHQALLDMPATSPGRDEVRCACAMLSGRQDFEWDAVEVGYDYALRFQRVHTPHSSGAPRALPAKVKLDAALRLLAEKSEVPWTHSQLLRALASPMSDSADGDSADVARLWETLARLEHTDNSSYMSIIEAVSDDAVQAVARAIVAATRNRES